MPRSSLETITQALPMAADQSALEATPAEVAAFSSTGQGTGQGAELLTDFSEQPRWLQQELRSDHAGEVGAVMIYRDVLAISRDTKVRRFADAHLRTEQQHLQLMEDIVPVAGRTRLLPVWRLMGWLTGAMPALFGTRAVFATIEAVETFVDHHYQQQILRLDPQGAHSVLRQILVDCQADEVSHRDEAAHLVASARGPLLRLWCAIVGAGSAAAVVAAKRI